MRLKKGWSFLGKVSPSESNIATASGVSPLVVKSWEPVEQMVEAVKDVATYVTPAETAGMTARAVEGFSCRTVYFGAQPAYAAMASLPVYATAATGIEADLCLLSQFPVAVSE